MSFVALIPARKNSKRIKNKNLLKYRNKTLVENAILHARKSSYIKDIYISTDSKKIQKIAKKKRIHVPFLRPKKLSGPKVKMVKVIQHFLQKTKIKKNYKYLVLLQPTSPLRKSKDIDASCNIAKRNFSDVVVSCYEDKNLKHHPKMMKVLNYQKKILDIKNKSKKKKFVVRNGPAILIINLQKFKENLYFGKTNFYLMPKSRSLDINVKTDLKKLNIKT